METNPRRIGLVLPPKLASDVERAAAAHETSLSEYVRDALRRRLASEAIATLRPASADDAGEAGRALARVR